MTEPTRIELRVGGVVVLTATLNRGAIASWLGSLTAPCGSTMLPLADAARVAGTSVRVLRDAIRDAELPAYGRQRDRAVRRDDLDKWIESRRVVHAPVDDADIERRMRRLRDARGRAA